MELKKALMEKARKLEQLAALLDDAAVSAEVQAWQESLKPVSVTPLAQELPQVTIKPMPLRPPMVAPQPVRTYKHRGLQAQVMRALFSGPATADELSACCQIERRLVMDAIGGMRSNGYATVGANGMVKLTPLGEKVATVFAENPRARSLAPGAVAAFKQQVNGAAVHP